MPQEGLQDLLPLTLYGSASAPSIHLSIVATQIKQKQFNSRRFIKRIYSRKVFLGDFNRRDLLNIMHQYFESPFEDDEDEDMRVYDDKTIILHRENACNSDMSIKVELSRKLRFDCRSGLRRCLAA